MLCRRCPFSFAVLRRCALPFRCNSWGAVPTWRPATGAGCCCRCAAVIAIGLHATPIASAHSLIVIESSVLLLCTVLCACAAGVTLHDQTAGPAEPSLQGQSHEPLCSAHSADCGCDGTTRTTTTTTLCFATPPTLTVTLLHSPRCHHNGRQQRPSQPSPAASPIGVRDSLATTASPASHSPTNRAALQ